MRIKLSMIALILVMGVLINSCKDDEKPTKTPEQIQTEKLTGTWVLETGGTNPAVTIDGNNDVSANWSGFTLTLGNKTYQTSNSDSPEIWPANGTWDYGTSVSKLVRNDDIEMTVSVSENTSLQLQFSYSASGGRLAGLEGNWIFRMVPQ